MERRRVWRKKRVVLLGLFVSLLGALAWLLVPVPDPVFHGKRESEWTKSISYGPSLSDADNQEQVKRWRDLGLDGVRLLARAVDKSDHPFQRIYRKGYLRLSAMLPRFLLSLLPVPKPLVRAGPPTNVIDLLSRLGKDADVAARAVARALKSEDAGVRNSAINFFTWGEGANCLLNRMELKEKSKLLPELLRAMQDHDWVLRNNAAIALRYYPEQRKVVVPVLTNAVHDSQPNVVVLSAVALNRVAPDEITNAGVVPIVIKILKNPDDQIAYQAAELLGEMKSEPALAVPALIESLENKSSLVASTAAQALVRFKEQANVIIPALEKAAQRTDAAGGWARSELNQLESFKSANQGVRK
jgi:hypothetical protein